MSGRVNPAHPGLNGVAEASAVRAVAPTPSASPEPPAPASYPATLALALLAFHRHVGPIFKGTEAKYGKFADLHAVLEVVTTPLLDQGLLLTQTLEEKGGSASQAPAGASAHPFGSPVAGSPADGGGIASGGQSLLRTQLLHAPSGESISSVVPLPTLNGMLGRLHELRVLALEQFPLDLDLAAQGAVPFVLPPKPAAVPTASPQGVAPQPGTTQTMPQRQPGLRLDDQIKGLQAILHSLGTTTNPLHSIGAAITYLRRYQILALLSLAAEDTDGHLGKESQEVGQRPMGPIPMPQGAGLSLVGRPAIAASTSPTPAAAFPMVSSNGAAPAPEPPQPRQQAARGRRLNRPVGVTPSPGAATATVLANVPATPVHPAAREPTPALAALVAAPPAKAPASSEAGDLGPLPQAAMPPFDLADLGDGAVQALIAEIRTLPPSAIPQLVQAFRLEFGLPAEAMVSDYIRTSGHAAFIREQIASLGGGLTSGGGPGNGTGRGNGEGA